MNDPATSDLEFDGLSLIRAGAIGFSLLIVIVLGWTFWIISTEPRSVDFLAYWAAAKLVLSNHASSAYNIAAHQAAETLAAPVAGLLPFPYPPPFLLVVTPFGLVSFPIAFVLWVTTGLAIYLLVVGRNGALPYAMSQPSVIANVLIGQNGFLTASILVAGTRLLERNSFLGGAILGLLIVKPQLALVLPFAMIAGREWKAIAGGASSALLLLLIAYLAFGRDAYEGFFRILPVYIDGMAQGRWPWSEISSTFASLRFLGVPQPLALVGHVAVAVIAIALVCRAWWLRLDERVPILAAAAMLIPPYLLTYDALFLAVPIIWLVHQRRHLALIPLIWLFCLLPVATYFHKWPGPNTVPLAAMLCLWALTRANRDGT